MKKNLVPILITVLVVLQSLSLARIGDLQRNLRDTQSQLARLESSQSSQMNNFYANIDSMLKRQSSIIDSFEYSFGKIDREKLTVPITFKITPKETTADTQATLYLSDESLAMIKSGTTFTGTLGVGIFEPIEAKIVLADGGIEKSEKLGIAEDLRGNVLPSVHARLERQSGTVYSKNANELTGEYHGKGNISLEVKPVQNNTIEKARFVVDIDGKVVTEDPVNTGGLWTEFDKKWTLSAGETLTMSVIATDSLGLNHKTIIEKLTLDESATPVHGEEWMWLGEVFITDQEGKVLSP